MIRVTVTVLWLLITVAAADAQPSAVSPFPGGLSGTIAFQSDTRSASNPNGRVRLYTINLASGAIAALGTGGGHLVEERADIRANKGLCHASSLGGAVRRRN